MARRTRVSAASTIVSFVLGAVGAGAAAGVGDAAHAVEDRVVGVEVTGDPLHARLLYLGGEAPERRAGEPVAAVGVDGCGAPLFGLSLTGLARAFGALVRADPGTPERRVADAMRCRGFDCKYHCPIGFRTTAVDVVGFLLVTVFSIALVLADRVLL